MTDELTAEDQKLITLARATRARIGAAQGAAIRDQDGRTYAAATVDLPSLQLSAVSVAVAMAVASGSRSVDGVALLGRDVDFDQHDRAVLGDFGGQDTSVLLCDEKGGVVTRQLL